MGRPLAAEHHDVRALDQDPALGRLPDDEVLALAAEQERILITHNIRDFVPLIRTWAECGRRHSGCVLVALPHDSFGTILRALLKRFEDLPRQEDWTDRTEFLAAETGAQKPSVGSRKGWVDG